MTLNKAKGRMFKSVGWTWNPIAGCTHDCKYCWATSLRKRWGKSFEPELREKFLWDKMPDDGTWIFVGSMGDVFCEGVPKDWLLQLFLKIAYDEKDNVFLFQTKNPARFLELESELSHFEVGGDEQVATHLLKWFSFTLAWAMPNRRSPSD